jgi:hypothetical protein
MADALPVSEADALAFVAALTTPVPHDLVDQAFIELVSLANDGPRTIGIDTSELDTALGRFDDACVWTVTPGGESIAQQPPFDDTPKKTAKRMDRVMAGYLAGVEVMATCTVDEVTYDCPEVDPEVGPIGEPDCTEVVSTYERALVSIALAPVKGRLLIRGWRILS